MYFKPLCSPEIVDTIRTPANLAPPGHPLNHIVWVRVESTIKNRWRLTKIAVFVPFGKNWTEINHSSMKLDKTRANLEILNNVFMTESPKRFHVEAT